MSMRIINCQLIGNSINGTTYDKKSTSISFDNGLITGIGDESLPAQQTIDAKGLLVTPGLVDCYARLREPGFNASASIASESLAAAQNGVTTLLCSPDTVPAIDEPAIVEYILRQSNNAGAARVMPIGALTSKLEGQQLSELFTLSEAGCVAFSNGDNSIQNTQVLRRVMEYAAGFDLRLIIAPQDPWLSLGVAHDGAVATRLGLAGIPSAAETVALSQLIELSYQTNAPLHFSRLSTERGVNLVSQAKKDGIKVTADTAIHHLFLSEVDVSGFNTTCHTLPPFRTTRDMQALRNGVAIGVIDAICSNHAPHDADSKLAPFPESLPGTSSLDGFMPLALRLQRETEMSLATVVDRITSGPARCFSLPQGFLDSGAPADLCIVDPDAEWELEEASIHSRGYNHPCQGWMMQGQIERTIVGGATVFERNR